MQVLELRYYLGARQEMALTRSYKELVQKPVASDPAIGEEIDTMLADDVDTGKGDPARQHQGDGWLREAWRGDRHQPKSLIRMFGPRGNPQARNLFGIIGYLQKQAGVELHVGQGPG
jgi:hypothetical protein